MAKATEKQINYINSLIDGIRFNITQSWNTSLFRNTQREKYPTRGLPRDEQNAINTKKHANVAADKVLWIAAVTAKLNALDTSSMSKGEASELINSLKGDFLTVQI